MGKPRNQLCSECFEECKRTFAHGYLFPWIHCHHDETKKTVCTTCLDGEHNPSYVVLSPDYPRNRACFCPKCGRKLGET